MKKEIKVENKNGYVRSYLTETNEFLHKKLKQLIVKNIIK